MEIALQAKEILEKQINEKAANYPSSLKPKDIQEIMSCSQTQAYDTLRKGLVPGAKKIDGLGWRIPKETFFAWWYGNNVNEKKLFKPVRRVK